MPATKNSKPIIARAKMKGMVPKITPKEIMKPAITFRRTCPATMLAQRRKDKVAGLTKNEKSSKIKIIGAMKIGTPLGKNMCKNPPMPLRTMAKIVTVKNEINAIARVIGNWLVAVKL